ncbi:MAG: GGDEF domain-containing protein [Desulfamplus sp.]|nr:GGDEF domain-containing protein [Desulfamplus sp.]
MTGIANRRYYQESFQKLWKHSMRTRRLISIIMIDIDNFKAYNDNYGHDAGDDCIRSVAQALRNTLQRPMDIVARYGGDEFVAILPETDLDGTSIIAESMLKAVRDLAIPHAFSSTADHVTISAGYISARPYNGQSPDELRDMANCALYMSKSSGRNQARKADIA